MDSILLHYFPEKSGCYIIRHMGAVLYVGQAQDMRERWKHHHHRIYIERVFPDATVEIVLCGDNRRQKEKELIKELKPYMNGKRYFQSTKPFWHQVMTNVYRNRRLP